MKNVEHILIRRWIEFTMSQYIASALHSLMRLTLVKCRYSTKKIGAKHFENCDLVQGKPY